MESVGIVSTGIYLPDQYITSKEISELAGMPQDIVEKN